MQYSIMTEHNLAQNNEERKSAWWTMKLSFDLEEGGKRMDRIGQTGVTRTTQYLCNLCQRVPTYSSLHFTRTSNQCELAYRSRATQFGQNDFMGAEDKQIYRETKICRPCIVSVWVASKAPPSRGNFVWLPSSPNGPTFELHHCEERCDEPVACCIT